MAEYSDWQLVRIREALGAYKHYERDHDGVAYTWKDVREAIASITGTEIGSNQKKGGERLRQFVAGNTNPETGLKEYPKPEWAKDVVSFLCDEDIGYLSADDLREFKPVIQAPLRLLEYLAPDPFEDGENSAAHCVGTYRLKFRAGRDVHGVSDFFVKTISIMPSTDSGVYEVIETEEVFDNRDFAKYHDWTAVKKREKRHCEIIYHGWGVISPEDTFMFFLKKEGEGLNRVYVSLMTDATYRTKEPLERIMMAVHEEPEDLVDFQGDIRLLALNLRQTMEDRVLIFNRVDEMVFDE